MFVTESTIEKIYDTFKFTLELSQKRENHLPAVAISKLYEARELLDLECQNQPSIESAPSVATVPTPSDTQIQEAMRMYTRGYVREINQLEATQWGIIWSQILSKSPVKETTEKQKDKNDAVYSLLPLVISILKEKRSTSGGLDQWNRDKAVLALAEYFWSDYKKGE